MAIERHETGPRMSRVVVHNGTVYLAGFTADDPNLPIQGQTRQVLHKIDRYLAMAGTDKSQLLTAQIWLADIAMGRHEHRLGRLGGCRPHPRPRHRASQARGPSAPDRDHGGRRRQIGAACPQLTNNPR